MKPPQLFRTPAPAPAPAAETPPWGEDFDAPRAWRTIQNQRTENDGIKSRAHSEQERLRGELTAAEAAATRAEAWRAQAVRSKAEALTAGKFVDTETVLLHLGDLTAFATDDAIDETKLATRLAELATAKPFLLMPATPQGLLPNRAQGQSGNGGPLTAAQVAAQFRPAFGHLALLLQVPGTDIAARLETEKGAPLSDAEQDRVIDAVHAYFEQVKS